MSDSSWLGPYVFVDVDTQRDFLDPAGALYLRGSGGILENLGRLTQLARKKGIPVLATSCAHSVDEEDPEPFPPHCLVGSDGQARIDQTRWEGSVVLGVGESFVPSAKNPIPPHLTIEKTRYDVFSRAETREVVDWLATRLGGEPTFIVYGVATDYCVECAVKGLLEMGHHVLLVADAVYAVNPDRETEHLMAMIESEAVLTTTDAVMAGVSAESA
jgi:nicotinamidase/pyrazinamidase